MEPGNGVLNARRANQNDVPSFTLRAFRNRGVIFLLVPFVAMISYILVKGNFRFSQFFYVLLQASRVARVYHQPQAFPPPPYTLASSRVFLPSHRLQPAYIAIDVDGRISRVATSLLAALRFNRVIVDVSPLVIIPGLIDPHVHVNEPGRESWEGFYSASRAAVAGGTTTILDMPLNNVPSTISRNTIALKVRALEAAAPIVDVGLIGGIVPENVENLSELIESGVLALKSFMIDSQSKDFPNVSKRDFERAIEQLHGIALTSERGQRLLPYILHAELESNSTRENPPSTLNDYDHGSYDDFERWRPASWETAAVQLAVQTANNSNVHIHIAHVSSHDVVQFVREMRERGNLLLASLTTETCPHYLLWAKEEMPWGATLFKCSPPIRSAKNRQEMMLSTFGANKGLRGIDLIASDHSPCPPQFKSADGNLSESWGGIAGLQYRLQGTWTAASQVTDDITRIVELLAEGPAKTFGLDKIKGFLRAGLDADIVVWDPDLEEDLTEGKCLHRHKGSPYHSMKARGVVFYTLLRGVPVFSRQVGPGIVGKGHDYTLSGTGQLLIRSHVDGNIRRIEPKQWMT